MMNGMSLHPYPKGALIGRQISIAWNLFLGSFDGIFLNIPKGIPQSTRLLLGTLGGCYIGYGMFDQLGRLGPALLLGSWAPRESTRGLSIGDCVASACPPLVLLG